MLLCGFSVGPSLAFFGLPCLVLGVLCSRASHVVFSSFGKVSDVRDFFGASLWLLRPSLAWCFPVREPCFGLPCLLFGVFFATVLAMSFLALLESFTSLWLLRPSLVWCFPVREPCFELPCLLYFSVFFCSRATNGNNDNKDNNDKNYTSSSSSSRRRRQQAAAKRCCPL